MQWKGTIEIKLGHIPEIKGYWGWKDWKNWIYLLLQNDVFKLSDIAIFYNNSRFNKFHGVYIVFLSVWLLL